MAITETPPRRTSPGRIFVIAAVVVVSLLAGFAAAQVWPRPPGDTSAEAGFARDMSGHHAQAVDMAMLAYNRATLPELKTIGYDIALTQQGQIGTMQAWLVEWHLGPTGSQPRMAWMPDGANSLTDGLMPGMATPEELTRLGTATGREFDVLFAQLMLRHHLGGIHMVDGVVAVSHFQPLLDLAGKMKKGQQAEIVNFRTILTQLDAKPLP